MKVTDALSQTSRTILSFELLPPLKGSDASRLYNTVENLLEFNPRFINITTHRDEIEFRERPDGTIERRVVRKRPGTVAIAASIQHKYGIPVVPHIVCGGFTRSETEHVMIDLHFLGIDNVLALRGDGLKGEQIFRAEPGGNAHAVDLVRQIDNLRKGIYLDQELKNKTPLDFCVGVAGYPEKHAEAPNLETDLCYLKQKVDAGADYIVTQMFFDNRKFFRFRDECRSIGIDVPVIAGIKPISALNDINLLPQTFHIDMPNDLVVALRKCTNDNEAREVGIEWAVQQSKELIAEGVPGIHYYTLGRSDNVARIVKAAF